MKNAYQLIQSIPVMPNLDDVKDFRFVDGWLVATNNADQQTKLISIEDEDQTVLFVHDLIGYAFERMEIEAGLSIEMTSLGQKRKFHIHK